MAEDVNPEVIKRTQDSLGKFIKRPPLTEKLLKKPPFRFLHDVVNNVIKETGFLQGLLTEEELNHENIKDRDGKIAFLQKIIDAVKSITGANLTVRPTKIVAGHEATKTNELLQAIGSALENQLSSEEYVAQLQRSDRGSKTKASSKRDEVSKTKSSSTSKATNQTRAQSQDRSKTKDATSKKKSSTEVQKHSKPQLEKKVSEEQGDSVAMAASEVSVVKKHDSKAGLSQSEKRKTDSSQREKKSDREKTHRSDSSMREKHRSDSSQREKSKPETALPEKQKSPEKHKIESSSPVKVKSDPSQSERHKTESSAKPKSERLQSATVAKPESESQLPLSTVDTETPMQQKEILPTEVLQEETAKRIRKRSHHRQLLESVDRSEKAKHHKQLRSEPMRSCGEHGIRSAKPSKPEGAAGDVGEKPADNLAESIKTILGGEEPIVLGTRDPSAPAIRPKSVRPKSARILHGRPKSRIEVVKTEETVETEGKVKVIPENDPLQEQDEDDTFVVVEAPPVLVEDVPAVAPPSQTAQPGDDVQHGHLVAQILETQKELEDEAQRSLPHQDSQNKKVEIEWDDAGRQRERELVSKEVERLRNSIQTLTRTANPLGKLMDFLQEDVDTMQRELRSWRITNNDLRRQLLEEERKTEQSIQPLKVRLEELNEKIELKLDEISAVKARIMESEESIRKNATPSYTMSSEFEEELHKIQVKYNA